MSKATPLPRVWDLSAFFPSFDGPEFRDFQKTLRTDLDARLREASALADLNATNVQAWAALFNVYENIGARLAHLSSYLGCQCAADAANERFQQEDAALAGIGAALSKLGTEFLRAFRAASDADWSVFLNEPTLGGAAHTLQRMRHEGRYQMSRAEEQLAADLGIDGISAWGRLYDTVSGKMTFEMTWPDGRRETVPMAQRRALLSNPDRAIRRAAFEGGNAVWRAHEDIMAAALNGIAGTRHTLYTRRGVPHFLDKPFFDAAVSRETIDAMFAAIRANVDLARGILRLGAKLQKTPKLAWYDLDAPRPLEPLKPISWEECVATVEGSFRKVYPALGDYFRSMIDRRWVESEKRANKRSGAFLTGSPVIKEERIFMTFAETMQDVSTLAHEAGHAWHTHLLSALRPSAQEYPMTLAETASTFAENVLLHGVLSDPGIAPARKAFLLDQQTSNATAYLLNIPMRFEFEKRFYEERRSGEVPVSRLKQLMVEAQREIYGDVLEEGAEDAWFWASKLHFFITGISFYNYPYTFGFLLSQALFAELRRSGTDFLPHYEAFLRATGSATCEEAVRSTLGWDIRTPEFWTNAIRDLEGPTREFEALVAGR
jgi:oligoendopeptidase F